MTPLQAERERRGYTRTSLSKPLEVAVPEIREWEEGLLVRPSAHAPLLSWLPELELWLAGHQATWDLVLTRVGSTLRSQVESEQRTSDLEAARAACRLSVEALDLLLLVFPHDQPRRAKTVLECAGLEAGSSDRGDALAVADSVRARLHLLQRRGLVARPADPSRVRAEAFHTTPAGRARVRLEFVVLSARGESP